MNLSPLFQNAVKAAAIVAPVAIFFGVAAIGDGASSFIIPTIGGVAGVVGSNLINDWRKKRLLNDPASKKRLKEIARNVGLPFAPKVYESPDSEGANATFSSVYMPEWLSDTEERRDFVYGHECAHIQMGDTLTGYASRFSYGFAAAAAVALTSSSGLALMVSAASVSFVLKKYFDDCDDVNADARELKCDAIAVRALNTSAGALKFFRNLNDGTIPKDQQNRVYDHISPNERIQAVKRSAPGLAV